MIYSHLMSALMNERLEISHHRAYTKRTVVLLNYLDAENTHYGARSKFASHLLHATCTCCTRLSGQYVTR
ncbi:hypothetical protein Mp_3g17590 [Marchantia polymorpha subsp. ruderalis]|uniref:Uncharacterized protein n=2 Tax=Marchantia polymorpha TaxID=3197 RepID=A0AAF6B1W3_MARPO|nr:hypothetical protein MARPO_0039s0037 [Marchantia polymorpha]BBN05997.1 hypothetical protein Mp_3g17590 [Marchantia polymorpha subsp. ruderalis]|eukprot:PTQ40529.1 hypothetical protein MARPO_0039s0037 [Marchantia polymorpha]